MKKVLLLFLITAYTFANDLYAQCCNNHRLSDALHFMDLSCFIKENITESHYAESAHALNLSGELNQSDGDGYFKNLASVTLPDPCWIFNIRAGSSKLSNSSIKDEGWTLKNELGYQMDICYIRKLNPLIAYGIGIGLSSYASQISIAGINDTIRNLKDLGGVIPEDNLEERIIYTNPGEDIRLTYLDVQLFLEFGNPNFSKMGYFIRLGVKISTPVIDKFAGTGEYSVKGYYPTYHVELEDIAELGFVSNHQIYNGSINYELNKINIVGIISGGVSLKLTNRWILRTGFYYDYGFTDISKENTAQNKNRIERLNYSYLLDSPGTSTRSFGAEIGLQYAIDLY